MSRSTGLQRRTTYLISLTLVKLESVGAAGDAEEAGAGGDGAPGPGGVSAAPRTPEPGRARRPERLFQRQDALRISTAGPGPPGPDAPRPRSPASPPAVPPKPDPALLPPQPPAVPPKPDPALLPPPVPAVPPKPDPRGAKGTLEGSGERGLAALDIPQPIATPRRPLLTQATWGGPEGPPEGSRAPPPPLDPPVGSPHPSAGVRRLRLAGAKPPKTGTRGTPEPRAGKGPVKAGGSRLSWPEGEAKGRPKAGGKAEGPPRARLSPSKGKSKTLDYSDLQPGPGALVAAPAAETGLKRGREGGRASTRDRKMLKFISGIFTKSPAATPTHPAPPWAPPGSDPARATPNSEYGPEGGRGGGPGRGSVARDGCARASQFPCQGEDEPGPRVLRGAGGPECSPWVLGTWGSCDPPLLGWATPDFGVFGGTWGVRCSGVRCWLWWGFRASGSPFWELRGGSGATPASVVPSLHASVCPRLHLRVTPVYPVPHLPPRCPPVFLRSPPPPAPSVCLHAPGGAWAAPAGPGGGSSVTARVTGGGVNPVPGSGYWWQKLRHRKGRNPLAVPCPGFRLGGAGGAR